MAEDEQFYTRDRGRVSGPFSREKVQELARRGRFRRQHQISRDGVTWERAASIPELFPAPAVRPRTPPEQAIIEGHPSVNEPPQGASNLLGSDDSRAEPLPLAEDISTVSLSPGEWSTNWYYTHEGQQLGPHSRDDLVELIREGHLYQNDYVWHPDLGDDWYEVQSVEMLFPAMGTNAITGDHGVGEMVGTARTSPLASASLVLGICGMTILFFAGSVMAVILGHVALRRIQSEPHAWKGRGLAIAGLTLGYLTIVVSLIALSVFAILVATGAF